MNTPHVRALAARQGLKLAVRDYGGVEAALAALRADESLAQVYLDRGLLVAECFISGTRRRPDYPFPGDSDDKICERYLRRKAGLSPVTRDEALAADVE